VNVLVLPGLGSIEAGRRRSGYCQLALSLLGVVLTAGALLRFGLEWVHSLESENGLTLDHALIWWMAAGVVVFFASWLWALGTSLRLLREPFTAKDS